MASSQSLPYLFDLFHDCKTKEQFNNRFDEYKHEITLMFNMANKYHEYFTQEEMDKFKFDLKEL